MTTLLCTLIFIFSIAKSKTKHSEPKGTKLSHTLILSLFFRSCSFVLPHLFATYLKYITLSDDLFTHNLGDIIKMKAIFFRS